MGEMETAWAPPSAQSEGLKQQIPARGKVDLKHSIVATCGWKAKILGSRGRDIHLSLSLHHLPPSHPLPSPRTHENCSPR